MAVQDRERKKKASTYWKPQEAKESRGGQKKAKEGRERQMKALENRIRQISEFMVFRVMQ